MFRRHALFVSAVALLTLVPRVQAAAVYSKISPTFQFSRFAAFPDSDLKNPGGASDSATTPAPISKQTDGHPTTTEVARAIPGAPDTGLSMNFSTSEANGRFGAVSPVPEPQSLILLAIGAALIGAVTIVRRRV